MVGDSLTSDIQGGVNAGLDTCWFNPGHAENPGKVSPTYEIASLEELYPLVMEPEELANLGSSTAVISCNGGNVPIHPTGKEHGRTIC